MGLACSPRQGGGAKPHSPRSEAAAPPPGRAKVADSEALLCDPRSDMKPEDMEKWAGRAQTVAAYSKKPMAAYQGCRSMLAKAGAGGLLAGVMAIVAVMAMGHVTDSF